MQLIRVVVTTQKLRLRMHMSTENRKECAPDFGTLFIINAIKNNTMYLHAYFHLMSFVTGLECA